MLIKMTKFHDLTSHSPSYYKIISPCGRHSIPLSRRCSFYFDLNGPGLPRYIWPALRVSQWYKQRKDEFQSHPLSLKANPYQRRKYNRIIYLLFSFPPPDNQAALPYNKWLRVSKQPWPLGRRFAVPFFSGPAEPELEATIRSDWIRSVQIPHIQPIWSGPIRPNPRT